MVDGANYAVRCGAEKNFASAQAKQRAKHLSLPTFALTKAGMPVLRHVCHKKRKRYQFFGNNVSFAVKQVSSLCPTISTVSPTCLESISTLSPQRSSL